MKHIQLNCELPAQLLSKNEELNDYDFILFHLFVKNNAYREYFSQILKEGKRMTILDNSAYEFYKNGEKFDRYGFCRILEEFDPTYFIIPDVLMDAENTLSAFREWKTDFPQKGRMAVPQGKSLKEWLHCYEEMILDGGFDYIGIPFHNDFFWDLGECLYRSPTRGYNNPEDWTPDDAYAQGRFWLLSYLYVNNLVDTSKKYHLLGSHNPKELKLISQLNAARDGCFNWITSIDTSYPVTKGITLKDLEEGPKESLSIDTFFELSLEENQVNQIVKNIQKFHGYKN